MISSHDNTLASKQFAGDEDRFFRHAPTGCRASLCVPVAMERGDSAAQTQLPKGYRPLSTAWIGLCLMLSTLATTLGYDQYTDYERVRTEAQSHRAYQVGVAEESLSKRLQAISNAIDAVRDEAPELLNQPSGVQRVGRRLVTLVAAMTEVQVFAVIDTDGQVRASNRTELIGQNLRNFEFFTAIRSASDRGLLHLSRPYISPTNSRVISAGKIITNAHGKFAGCVLAMMSTEQFENQMRSLLFTPEMRVALIHADGEVILRVPDPEELTGKNLSEQPNSLFAQYVRTGERYLFVDSRSSVTGKEMLGVITQITPESTPVDKPLVLAALLDKQALFAPWRSELMWRLCLFLSFALLSIFSLSLYQRRQGAYARLANDKLIVQRKAEAQIKVIAEQLTLALEGAQMGAYLWNIPSGEIIWTDSYRRVLGIGTDIVGSYENWLATIHPDDRLRADLAVQHAMAEASDLNIEYRIIAPDGTLRWIASKGRFFRAENGTLERLEGLVSDITERKHAEQLLSERAHQVELLNVQLERRAIDAEAATRSKEAFMRAISHELRTPLNHIMAAGNIIRRGPLDSKQQHWLDVMRNASKELLRMVSGILDVTDLADGRLQLESMPFSPTNLLDDVRLTLLHKAEAKHLPVTAFVSEHVPTQLIGDPIRLSQALFNLLDNAIKFTEAGRIELSASLVSMDADGVLVRFEVTDTWIGVAADALSEICSESHKFRQLDAEESRKHGGLGFGLTHTRELAKRMGGEIGADSEVNRGSRFWLTAYLKTE